MKTKLLATTNYEYLSQFMNLAKGRDWVDNIPELTKDNIAQVGNAIIDLKPARDMFYDEFIVKIKEMLFDGLRADNKFAFMKGPQVSGIIEDTYVDYIKGKNFDPEDTTLLKNVKANMATLYHKVDSRMIYETSISDAQLREAFLSNGGLDTLLGTIVNTLYESAEWDEFTKFKESIATNVKYAGKVIYLGNPKVLDESGAETAETDWRKVADAMLFNLRKYSKDLTYVSRDHNILELAQRTSLEQQLVIMHKDMALNIDFASLANIFNLDKVETATNMVEVDNFNENDFLVGAVMTKNAWKYRDELRTTETFRNPQTLTTKYFFHLWQMISYSYLYNAIYFVLGTEEELEGKLNLANKADLESKIIGK